MNVTLHLDGGGDSEALKRRCREAFRKLLERAGLQDRMPRIVACGSRGSAFDDFHTAHVSRGDADLPVLIVDSEEPMSKPPWDHLQERDGWQRPGGAEDEQAQLMVTCMETWIVADRPALRKVFGKDLIESAIPKEPRLEERTRDDVQDWPEAATKRCPRDRRYQKGRRSFQVVSELDPAALQPLLPHFRRFIETLRRRS